MATFVRFTCFKTDVGLGVHNLNTDELRVALTNTAPQLTDTVFNTTVYPAPVAANGYTANGHDIQNSFSAGKLMAVDVEITATAGGIGPFRYEVVYNYTSAGKQVIGYYDRGDSITLLEGEKVTIDFDGVNGIFAIN
jgi:hypothetical protein